MKKWIVVTIRVYWEQTKSRNGVTLMIYKLSRRNGPKEYKGHTCYSSSTLSLKITFTYNDTFLEQNSSGTFMWTLITIVVYSYCMTQILMGHGCFEAYLFEIERNASPICAHGHVTLIRQCTRCCFVHLGSRRGRHFLNGWGSMFLRYIAPLSKRLCVPMCIGRP